VAPRPLLRLLQLLAVLVILLAAGAVLFVRSKPVQYLPVLVKS
jgi:hypothetical protein